jgi:hypothetical protein
MQTTSSARPAGPWTGQTIYDTDTKIGYQYDGTNWGPTYPGSGIRNLIINGDMTVNQRGYTSASPVSVSTGSQVYYSTDRWYGSGETSQGVYSLGQSTTVPSSETFINSLVATCTTADTSLAATDDYEFGQAIEGFNASFLGYGTSAAKQSVLSFWVRSSLTGIYCVALRNSASNRSYVAEYTINVADTWEKKTIYINGDTTGTWLKDTSIGVNVTWALAVGSTYQTAAGSWTAGNYLCSSNQVNWMSSSTTRTFYITGVQLEQNYQPTPFEQRPIGVQLALCQRYYWRGGNGSPGIFNGSTTARYSIVFPTTMRTAPTTTAIAAPIVINPTVAEQQTGSQTTGFSVTAFGESVNYSAAQIQLGGFSSGIDGRPTTLLNTALQFSAEL